MSDKAASIFLSFDPERVTGGFAIQRAFTGVPNLFLLLLDLLALCARPESDSNAGPSTMLDNAQFTALEAQVAELASVAYRNRCLLPEFPELDSLEFGDLPLHAWALHGKRCAADSRIGACQIIALHALKLIDRAMVVDRSDGAGTIFLAAMAEARALLEQARDAYHAQLLHIVRPVHTMQSGVQAHPASTEPLHAASAIQTHTMNGRGHSLEF